MIRALANRARATLRRWWRAYLAAVEAGSSERGGGWPSSGDGEDE